MRKSMLFVFLLLCFNIVVLAQTMRVTGRITDSNGRPVENASVLVKGSRSGVTTNSNGEYTISADKGQTLVISSIGFTQQEVVVEESTLNVSLGVNSQTLSDVVVVGYGTQRRAAVTGSIVTLRNDVLTKRQVASTSSLLQGLAPGVTVQQQSGKPGGDGASIRIRGISSIVAGSSPLVMVDGVVSSLENIDPNAIESITVLKDAASTAIYGTRASNGVILVKTKRGTGKGISLSYNNFFSKQVATAIPKRVSAIEHMELSNVAVKNYNPAATPSYSQALIDKYKTTPANNLDVIDTDWLDLLLTNSGLLQNHNVQLNAGGERVNVFASVTYLDQQGLIQNNSFKKYDIRFNPDFKLSDKLTLSGVFNYNNSTTLSPSTGTPELIIRQAIGLPAVGGGKYGPGMYGTAGQTNNRNPIAMAEATGTSVTEQNSFLSKVALNYKPVAGLDLEAYWARESWTPHGKSFMKNVDIFQPNVTTSSYDKIGVWPGTASLGESYSTNTRTTYLAQATYGRQFGAHDVKVLGGAQTEEFAYSGISASRTGFINPDQPYLNLGSGNINNSGSAYETALAGFYGRLNYSYNDRYIFELNGRYDGSSRFSQALDKQWGFFPSVSAGWILSKENFWSGLADNVRYAKLRGSVGSLGNQALPEIYPFTVNYQATTYNNPNNGTSTYFNSLNTLGYALLDAANSGISWETSKQWNVGLDLGVGQNINFTADYFVRSLGDMLLLRPIPTYVGVNSPYINAGDMENRGWEVSMNYKKSFGKLNMDVTGMLSDVKNKVTSLPGLPYLDGGSVRTQVGQPLNSYFGYQAIGYFQDSNDVKNSPVQFGGAYNGTNPTVGSKPGDIKYADISGPDGKSDGKVDAFDRTFIGNSFTRYEYSINFNLAYGAFDLNLFGQGVGKRDNYLAGTGAVPFNSADFVASLLDIHKDFWTPENREATFPRLLPAGQGGNNYFTSTHWIRSASYFRIKNVNLGFRLPEQWLKSVKINSARVYVSGSNLLTFTKSWDGFDPEIDNANAQFYPLMKTFTAGVNINF